MHPDYQPHALIEVKIGMDLFQARVRGTTSRRVLIEALDPETFPYPYCDFEDVVRVLEHGDAETDRAFIAAGHQLARDDDDQGAKDPKGMPCGGALSVEDGIASGGTCQETKPERKAHA